MQSLSAMDRFTMQLCVVFLRMNVKLAGWLLFVPVCFISGLAPWLGLYVTVALQLMVVGTVMLIRPLFLVNKLRKAAADVVASKGTCWEDMIDGLVRGKDIKPEIVKKLKSGKTLISLYSRFEAREELACLAEAEIYFAISRFGVLSNHISTEYFETEGSLTLEASCMVKVKDIMTLPFETRKIRWYAGPPANLSFTAAAIGTTGLAIVNDNSVGNRTTFTRKTIGELHAARNAEWGLHRGSFEFYEIAGHDEVHLPSTQTGVAAIAAQTSGELFDFLGGTTAATRMTWLQSLCLTMILTNGHTRVAPHDRTYFRCFDVRHNGNNVYFTFPAGLSNAAVRHGVAHQYKHWVAAAHAQKNWGKVSIVGRLLQSWGYNLCLTHDVESAIAGTKVAINLGQMTLPSSETGYFGTGASNIHADILESFRKDVKKVTDAIVAVAKKNAMARAVGGERKALPEIPETEFLAFSKAGITKKRAP